MLFDKKDITAGWRNSYSESEFESLSRAPLASFERVRNLIEDWLRHYPIKNINELLPRFRSRDDSVFRSTFFELYLHELLLGLGFTIEVHPMLSQAGTHPEFLVFSQGEPAFYMEATCEFGPRVESSKEKLARTVIDYINKNLESSDFYLGVNILSSSTADPPKGKWVKSLNLELSGLNPDSTEYNLEKKCLSFSMTGNGWEVVFDAFPRPEQERGELRVKPIPVRSIPVSWGERPSYIENAFHKKHDKRYGEFKLP
jgi:hypothetical protein